MYKELRLTMKKLQTKRAGKGCEHKFPALKYHRWSIGEWINVQHC